VSFIDDYASIGPGNQAGSPLNITPGASGGGSSSSSPVSLGSLGTLAAGGAGLAGLLSLGEDSLPPEFGQVEQNAGTLESESGTLFNEGQTYENQGAQALQMAQNGQLTQPQQAQLQLYQQGLTNTADQTYASMGRNINQDTSGISTQANIDAQVNAMANQQIQTTIAQGLAEGQLGNSFTGQSSTDMSLANQALIQAGQAQMQADQSYSNALSGVFSAIGTIAGGAIGAAAGGPMGAIAGATIGRAV
jgi:hypothetical protein